MAELFPTIAGLRTTAAAPVVDTSKFSEDSEANASNAQKRARQLALNRTGRLSTILTDR